MFKTLITLATLTLLVSCTMPDAQTPTPATPTKQMAPDAVMPKTETASPPAPLPQERGAQPAVALAPDAIQKDTTPAKLTGYMNYDAAKVQSALASGQRVALFFHATWCPSCRALDKAITSGTVPSDAIIFQVDYDTSTELKKQYRVVTQHTTVVLNADGSEKMKKLGARTVAEVLGQ